MDKVCNSVTSFVFSGYLQKHHEDLFDPDLPQEKVETINAFKMGTVNKIFLEFEEPFPWDEENPGFQFLHAGDEKETNTDVRDENYWLREIIGFDAVMNQPNMLVGWMSGQAAK